MIIFHGDSVPPSFTNPHILSAKIEFPTLPVNERVRYLPGVASSYPRFPTHEYASFGYRRLKGSREQMRVLGVLFTRVLKIQDSGSKTRCIFTRLIYCILCLYVSGMTPNSRRAIENVRKICAEHLDGRYQLEIIDFYRQPIFAKKGKIMAASSLVKELPPPLRWFIGDISQDEKVLVSLDLHKK
jgi:circadian clock protein KaiB